MYEKIIFFLDSFDAPTAGTEGQFDMLYKGLLAQGHRPKVLTFRRSAYLAGALPQGTYQNLGIASLANPVSWYKAMRAILAARREGVQLAHLFFNDTSVLLPVLLRLAGIRTIISRRDLGFWYTRGVLAVLRLNRLWVTQALANCQAVKAITMRAEGYPENKVRVILNGVKKPDHIKPFGLRDTSADAIGKPITPSTVIFGIVANLRPLKRVNDAITAVTILNTQGLDLRLVVAGADVIDPAQGGSQLHKLQVLAAAGGVADLVSFTGPLSPVWGFLNEIDVLLSCSDTEGLSNSIIEAMACEKPVIATEVGGSPDVVNRGVTGLLYPPRDVAALSHAMQLMVTEPARRVRMGKAGGDFVRARLTQDALIQAHADLYRKLLPA